MSDHGELGSYSADDLLGELRAREAGREEPPLGAAVPMDALRAADIDTILQELTAKQKVIYGADDRQDVIDVTDPALLNDVDSVVALFEGVDVIDNGNGTSTLQTRLFSASQNLCSTERFR